MTGATLQCLAVLHHRLNGICVEGAGKTLRLALHTLHHRHCHPFLSELGIYLQHLLCLGLGLLAGGMGGVALLPQELRCAEERARAHLPAHHVAPLVAHQGQVAP